MVVFLFYEEMVKKNSNRTKRKLLKRTFT